MGRIVNQRELAEIMGITQKSLSLWQRDGLPVKLETESGLSNQYDTAEVIAWYVAREIAKNTGESPKDRLARLQGDMAEIDLDAKRGILIEAIKIEPAWSGMIVAARQTLLSMSARLSQLLAPMDNPDSIRILIDEEVESALGKLANYEDSTGADGAASEGVLALGAPAENRTVAMG